MFRQQIPSGRTSLTDEQITWKGQSQIFSNSPKRKSILVQVLTARHSYLGQGWAKHSSIHPRELRYFNTHKFWLLLRIQECWRGGIFNQERRGKAEDNKYSSVTHDLKMLHEGYCAILELWLRQMLRRLLLLMKDNFVSLLLLLLFLVTSGKPSNSSSKQARASNSTQR